MVKQQDLDNHGDGQKGLLVALCRDVSGLNRINQYIASAVSTLEPIGRLACGTATHFAGVVRDAADQKMGYWRFSCVSYVGHEDDRISISVGEPLIEACFCCLRAMPGGGFPWQGSWRRDPLKIVCQTLQDGGVILVLAADSLREQRDWTRALLQCQCVFVQVHHGHENVPRKH